MRFPSGTLQCIRFTGIFGKETPLSDQQSRIQSPAAAANLYSRRSFLRRAALGAAVATAATLAAGRLLAGGSKQALPGQGSIFEPRKKDLQRYWQRKLGRFRLN